MFSGYAFQACDLITTALVLGVALWSGSGLARWRGGSRGRNSVVEIHLERAEAGRSYAITPVVMTPIKSGLG